MKKKIIKFFLLSLCTFNLISCGRPTEENTNTEEISSTLKSSIITEETSNLGIKADDPDILNKLVSGTYYVLHNGIYYPTQLGITNYDISDVDENVTNPQFQHYFAGQDDDNIPTLFLGNNDKLIYYNTESLLDYTIFDRYYDYGYTVGLYNIRTLDSGKMYLDLSSDNEYGSILETSTMYNVLKDVEIDNVYVNSMNQTEINTDIVHYGLIGYTEPGALYDVELYDGTNYNSYKTLANMHAFVQMEKYAVRDCKALQSYIFEIPIPDYLEEGYYGLSCYSPNGCIMSGLFRYVKGTSFTNDPNYFNNRLLYTKDLVEELNTTGHFEEEGMISIYSDYEPLNQFTCEMEGYFGYKSDDDTITGLNNSAIENVEKEKLKIKINNISFINLPICFMKDKKCQIEIIPDEDEEENGEIFIQTGIEDKIKINYNRLTKSYILDYEGDGNTYLLAINQLYKNYTIKLTNCTKDSFNNVIFPITTDINGNPVNQTYEISLSIFDLLSSNTLSNTVHLTGIAPNLSSSIGTPFTVLHTNKYLSIVKDIDGNKYLLNNATSNCYLESDVFSLTKNISEEDLLKEMTE